VALLDMLSIVLIFWLLIAFLLWVYRWPPFRAVLDFGTTLMRYRYCLLLCIAPAALGATAYFNPFMLSALLVVRGVFDIAVITMICFFAVGVGLAEMRLIQLHGHLRFPNRRLLLSKTNQQQELDSEETSQLETRLHQLHAWLASWGGKKNQSDAGWSPRQFLAWFSLSLIMPGFCLYALFKDLQSGAKIKSIIANGELLTESQLAGIAEPTLVGIAIGIGVGTAIAMLAGMALAVLQYLVLGRDSSTSGILPFEFVIAQNAPNKSVRTNDEPSEARHKRGFLTWLLGGPGYTDAKTGRLLPGQSQNLILMLFSAAVYLINYAQGTFLDNSWEGLDWPTGFYAVLLLFLIGFFMTGLAYWLDRYGLPPIVFAVAYVAAGFYLGASDHYFEVDVIPRKAPANQTPDNTNTYVAAAQAVTSPDVVNEQLYWADILKKKTFYRHKDKKTLVIVTASGGGIQAAVWTAKVLTELDQRFTGFRQSIGLISSVSGGSVGTMYYIGHRPIDPGTSGTLDTKLASKIRTSASMSSLEAVSWGLAFPDFVRALTPASAPNLLDRGSALEMWWWNQMGRTPSDRQLIKDVTLRDLIPLIESNVIPPVIFNATCVETGQRVQISPLHVGVARPTQEEDWHPEWDLVKDKTSLQDRIEALQKSPLKYVATPIDFLDFYDACLVGNHRDSPDAWTRSNLRVSTAARLSATFSYVTPVARPCPKQGFGLKALIERRHEPETADPERRLFLHFCDGGYADNPGLVTAVESLRSLLERYQRDGETAPFDQVLIVRIEPFPQTAADLAKDNSGYESAVYGPSQALSAMRVSTQAERGELELQLLQDLSAPRGMTEPDQTLDQMKNAVASRNESRLKELMEVNDVAVMNRRKLLPPAGGHANALPPVFSVTFRFKLHEKDRDGTEPDLKDPIVTPPLTWTLTNSQKLDVELAWDILEKKRWKEPSPSSADNMTPNHLKEFFPDTKPK
jgi:hypothetical protein